ncbi:MAG: VCBS repeat-containing protein [Alphaproteobacteria bacterium]|nr:VCBS repeat-containing protein [Alphaproteobacteria bacterium]
MSRTTIIGSIVLSLLGGLVLVGACSGGEQGGPKPEPAGPEPVAPAPKAPPEGPLPGLILVQARFDKVGGKPKPKPATMWLFRTDGEDWYEELVEDPKSNVFHKGMYWRDGILTIGAMEARLTHWKHVGGEWQPEVLWQQSWGGKFDRLRDIEIADVTGDGKEDIVLATHDFGVVAVGTEGEDGKWSFVEMDKTADTFVHEIEIGDVDGDNVKEFYATPSERNKSSGASQPGAVSRYDYVDGKFVRSWVVQWEESHAKEILVTDVDGDGTDELYAVREAHVVVNEATKEKERVDPVRIVQMVKNGGKWDEKVVATLDDEMCRFLLPADVNHDGKTDLVASGKTSGIWMLERKADGTFEHTQIDAESGGFEHATHAADLDGDGKLELYVASDDQKELRRYLWNGTEFHKEVIAEMPPRTITWNIQDGRF